MLFDKLQVLSPPSRVRVHLDGGATTAGKVKSKMGKLTLECNDGVYTTMTEGKGDPAKDVLVEVYRNGKLLKVWSFEEVRERAKF